MLNPYKLKKWGAMIISAIVPSLFFTIVLNTNGFMWAIGAMFMGGLISIVIASAMLKNPFQDLLEGKGLLALNLTSTGIIQPFIMGFDKNFIKGGVNGEYIEEFFDRESTQSLSVPVKGKNKVVKTEDGDLLFKIDSDQLNTSRFAFNQYPVLLYNSMSKTFLTKEQLADFEKKIIAYNKLIFLTKKVEDLSISVKNFARHIVDNLKPKAFGGGMPSWVIILLVIVVIGFVVLMILKSGGGGAIAGAVKGASSSLPGSPINPAG